MRCGPVLSQILNLLNGQVVDEYWKQHISTARNDNHLVKLLEAAPTTLLTENEKESLERAYNFFSQMTWDQVKAFCHREFKEWKNPGSSRTIINFEDIVVAAGKSKAFVKELLGRQQEEQFLDKLLA
jgi:hypothetical protein